MRSLLGILCAFALVGTGCGGAAAPAKDAAVSSDVAIVSGGAVGRGGTVGSGGHTSVGGFGGALGGAMGTGGSTSADGALGTGGRADAGGALGTGGGLDAGRDVPMPIRETEEHIRCASTDDCHVVLDECVCAAVNTQGAELVDKSIHCGTNDCLSVVRRVTDAVCENGKCTLVRDPPCAADSDCRVLWARCYPAPLTRDCACAAVHVSNQATRELVSPDGMCTRNMSENGRAFCENGRCSLVGVYPG